MPQIVSINFDLTNRKEKVKNSITVLKKTRQIVTRFLKVYREIASRRTTNRNQTEEQTDVLRAMFIFASSGLDSVVKQLIEDCLELIVKQDEGAQLQMKTFLKQKLSKDDSIDINLLADLFSSPSPWEKGVKMLKYNLTGSSLQSAEQLLIVGAYFNIKSESIVDDVRELKAAFSARNEIIHRMDVSNISHIRKRRGRPLSSMCDFTNLMLVTSERFINEVEKKLR